MKFVKYEGTRKEKTVESNNRLDKTFPNVFKLVGKAEEVKEGEKTIIIDNELKGEASKPEPEENKPTKKVDGRSKEAREAKA